jgi:3-deoxy-D-manno-octulosonic-acid transferase
MILSVYRGLSYAVAPLLRCFLEKRKSHGKEHPDRFKERFGQPSQNRPAGAIVWLHAASVGEAISVLSLVNKINREYPSLSILMTTGTVTSAAIMAERLPKNIIHQFIPVDQPLWIQSFMDHWQPDLVLWVESEFWPNLLRAITTRKIPIVLINARISPNSFRKWQRVPRTISRLLSCFSVCLAQSDQDADKLIQLGANTVRVPGNLKYAADPLPVDDGMLTALWNIVSTRPVWIAASTHKGEEEPVANAHYAIAENHPGLLTIIVPRHPIRGKEIAISLANLGLTVSLRSENKPVQPETQIYIADTVGELGLFYRISPIAFIGGTLIPHGGQNMLEAAKLECAIIHGPSTSNFSSITNEISEVDGAIEIQNGVELAVAVSNLLNDEKRRKEQISAALGVAKSQNSILDKIIEELEPFLAPLKIPSSTNSEAQENAGT